MGYDNQQWSHTRLQLPVCNNFVAVDLPWSQATTHAVVSLPMVDAMLPLIDGCSYAIAMAFVGYGRR